MNHLAQESSPYLLQHKNNPVDWFPWGPEALKKAKEEDKVIVLSIGYSACHWCHVMEHECFEDTEVAAVMNEHFVNIKVDREERPDIDNIYMDALQAMGQRGGWPLNVFLLPGGEPFYGGTYFPKAQWMNVLYSIADVFQNRREEVETSGKSFVGSLNIKDSEKYALGSAGTAYTEDELRILSQKIKESFDHEDGGMNRAPKFPMPCVWGMVKDLFLLTDDKELREHLGFTLDRIALGGIYDHLGGGWTRYSTDAYWKVPHFEKMLYDNGQLMGLYAQASRLFPENEIYPWAIELAYGWLKEHMDQQDGGLYSAQDADSEGEEGKYYVWQKEEIQQVLGVESEAYNHAYDITEEGNWEHGNNVLHLETLPTNWVAIKQANIKLNEVRKGRILPGLDNKVITSWNALMLSGLIERSKVFGSDFSFAKAKLDYLNENLTQIFENEDGDEALGLNRLGGSKQIPAFLEDYATLIQANIDMYSLVFEEDYLAVAGKLAKYCVANFYDYHEGLFFYTDITAEVLIARKKEIFDNVIPSSNSLMAKALYFLGRFTANEEYITLAKGMFGKMKPLTLQDPQWLANWVSLGILFSKPQKEIVVTGPAFLEWISEIREVDSSAIILGAEKESDLALLKGRFSDKTRTFICEDKVCGLPIDNVEEVLSQM